MTTETNRSYVLSGTILSNITGTPVSGLRVEVWDKGRRWLHALDSAVTDSRGRFHVALRESYRTRLFPEGPAELHLLVFDAGTLVANTLDTFSWSAETPSTDVLLRVGRDAVGPETPSMFVVRGRVEDASTGPVSGLLVRAFDRNPAPGHDPWRDDLLAGAYTDAGGWYEIHYQPASMTRAGKTKADLVVQAFSADPPTLLAESAILYRAEAIAEVDLTIDGSAYEGPSEVENLSDRVASALADGGIDLTLAKGEHIGYLAASAGVDEGNLRLLQRATLIGQATNVPVHAVYGLGRMGLPVDLRLLVPHGTAGLKRALERAIAQDLVPRALGGDLDTIMPTLRDAVVDAVIAAGSAPDSGALGAVMTTSLTSPETQRAFLSSYLDFDGSADAFWGHLATVPGFEDPDTVEDLKLTMRIALLTHNNVPLMERISAARSDGTVRTLADLAAYDADDWQAMLEAAVDPRDGVLPIPVHIPGATTTERAANYVKAILHALGRQAPTRYLAQHIAKAPAIDMTLVRAIQAANPDLDPSEPLPADAAGVSDWQAANASWEALRREIKAFSGFDHEALIASSQPFANPVRDGVATFLATAPDFEIQATPIDAYVASNPSALGAVPTSEQGAVLSHLKATQRVFQITPLTEHVTGLMAAGLDSARRIARMPRALFVEQFTSLFGSPDEAKKVYFKALHHAGAMASAHTAIRQAATDILPYVIRGDASPDPADFTSLFGSLSLCDCQHCRSVYSPAAYLVDLLHGLDPAGWNVVDESAHPVKKPADVLFARRPDLQHISLTCENTNTPIPYIDLVNEVLESYIQARFVQYKPISIEARDTGKATAAELRAVPQYVMDSAYGELQEAVYPASLPYHRPLDVARLYLTHLGTSRFEVMKTFAPASAENDARLSAEELLLSDEEHDIIAGVPQHPPVQIEEYYGYPAGTPGYLSDVARVPEMLARTGVSYEELTELVETWFVNQGQSAPETRITLTSSTTDCDLENTTLTNLDAAALSRLHRFLRLQRKLGWSFADLDRALFAIGATDLDPTALAKLALVKRLAEGLGRPGVEVLSLWSPIDTWNDDALYLRLFQNRAVASLADLEGFALAYPFGEPEIKSASQLPDVAATATLDPHIPVILAALGITHRDLGVLLGSAGLTVDSALNVANLSALYRRAFLAKALGLRIPDLVTLLDLADAGDDPFASPDGAARFVEIARRVQRSGFTVRLLDYLYRDETAPAESPAPTSDRIAATVQSLRATILGIIADAEIAAIAHPDPEEPGAPTPQMLDQQKRGAVIEHLSGDLDLPATLTKALLESLLDAQLAPGVHAMDDFLALGSAEIPDTSLHDIEESYRALHKAALLIRGFALKEREIVYISAHAAAFDGFDLNALSPSPSDPVNAFKAWGRIADFVSLRDGLPRAEATLIDLFELTSAAPGGADVLARITGWDATLVGQLVGASILAFQEADYHDERRLLVLRDCVALSRRVGVAPDKLHAWATEEIDAAAARDIVQAAKARHDDKAWLDIARPLNDTLREHQRSALVAYLVPRMRAQGIRTDDDLFQHFLIDVDMSACMATSRIKQAISSVQLFVQRSLLNLETEVSPAHIDSEKWKWQKSYRVWEANRKVFLYPENWIEPELRAGKSPFFRELETELLSAELTDETAETALTTYLEKLDDTAALEPCGMYWQEELGDEPIDVLHVFARTQSEPRHYYYRRFVDRREWTPWERVELDIQGDHLIPVVYNRRLYLFWAVFKTVANEKQPVGKEGEVLQPATHLEISLVWSEYRQAKWTSKQTSSAKLLSSSSTEPKDHTFRAIIHEDGTLFIGVRRSSATNIWAHDFIGSFWTDDCRAGVRAGDWELPDESFPVLYGGIISGMAFEVPELAGGHGTVELMSPQDYASMGSVLDGVPKPYRLLYPAQVQDPSRPTSFGPTFYPFFYQDSARVYFARPVLDTYTQKSGVMPGIEVPDPAALVIGGNILIPKPGTTGTFSTYEPSYPTLVESMASFGTKSPASLGSIFADTSLVLTFERLAFSTFSHPHTAAFVKAMRREGVAGVLTLENQQRTHDSPNPGDLFTSSYHPTGLVHTPGPTADVTFEPGDAYALYNWELFFHAPLLIATQLSANQRYEDAQRWFHTIFDPTTHAKDPAPKRFWKVRPFHDNEEYARAQDLMALLSYAGTDAATLERKQKVRDQVADWAAHPFDPHRIARLRLVAYQKSVVMKYIDNLIGWADQLFSRDTLESINEATQLYVLAANLLGPRPERVRSTGSVAPLTYADMRGKLDDFSDVAVAMENVVFPFSIEAPRPAEDGVESILATGDTLYFCTPQNDNLLGYWDKVADRLFKIRNCMNIDGIVRTLPLFEPPIDPALLVRAVAAGVDLGSVLSDLGAPMPHYRFSVLLQKALELAGELKSLGGALLSAIEKKDGEALSALRTSHESSLLKAVRRVREQQIKEAETALEGLSRTRAVTEERHQFYANIAHRSAEEKEHVHRLKKAQTFQEAANFTEVAVANAAQAPNATLGTSGWASPVATTTFGATNAIAAIQSASKILMWKAGYESYKANLASIKGGWKRRSDDWKLQARLAKKELAQIDKQIEASRIRIEIAQAELDNNALQADQAASVEAFLEDKYSNQELYGWMITQVSALYFQTYKMAYDMAKRAERAYRFERGLESSSYIQFGYWDSLRKGLFAGERLALDLKRLDAAYLDQNKREYEITKQVSLALHDPAQLISLKQDGVCDIVLPEALFDADYPGHYFRRIKSVSLTLPCVTGPYASINCTLTLQQNRTRVKSTPATPYAEQSNESPKRFVHDFVPRQSVATSHAQGDSGVFELNFRDERYLPFEGAGADCTFHVELPKDCNAIDFNTISDLVLKVSYTARDAVATLQTPALDSLRDLREHGTMEPKLQRLISARDELTLAWNSFVNVPDGTSRTLGFTLGRDHFSYLFREKNINIKVTEVALHVATTSSISAATGMTITAPGGASLPVSVTAPATGTWSIQASTLPADIVDMFIVLTYTVTEPTPS